MSLKQHADIVKLLINLRHSFLKRLEMLVVLCLSGLVQGIRGADTGNNILALSIDKPLTVELIVSIGRITGKCHTGS